MMSFENMSKLAEVRLLTTKEQLLWVKLAQRELKADRKAGIR